jgi:hypothetical protein
MINASMPITFFQLVNLATGFYRSYQLGLIEFVGIGVLYLIHFSIVASFLTARFLCVLLGEYDGVKAFSCISNTLVAFILAMFSALLFYAVYNNHRQLMMPWLFTTILIACTRDVYMLIRSFFYASAGTWLGVLYVTAMVMQISMRIVVKYYSIKKFNLGLMRIVLPLK